MKEQDNHRIFLNDIDSRDLVLALRTLIEGYIANGPQVPERTLSAIAVLDILRTSLSSQMDECYAHAHDCILNSVDHPICEVLVAMHGWKQDEKEDVKR